MPARRYEKHSILSPSESILFRCAHLSKGEGKEGKLDVDEDRRGRGEWTHSGFCERTEKLTGIASLQVVIIQPVDNGNKPHPFGHAVVAGIERYPSKITRRMSKSRQEKRSKIKPFIKVINYNHLMPTRYTLELEGLKGAVSGETFKEVTQREDAKKNVKKVLEERYTSGKNRWFFTPLSMSTHPAVQMLPPSTCANHGCRILKKISFSPSRLGSWRDVKSIEWHLGTPVYGLNMKFIETI
jgi:large subunit ribosomal protein L27e